MTRTPSTRLAALVLAAALAPTAFAGCSALSGDDDPEQTSGPAETASPTPSASPGSTPSGTPSVDPSPSETPSPASPSPTAGASLAQTLLAAGDLPGFNDAWRWAAGATRSAEPGRLAGTCHRFELTSIGATEVAHRGYRPPRSSNAVGAETVAEFADPETARRAYRTLLAWRATCPEQLDSYPRVDVRLIEDVRVDEGEGAWWLAIYGPVGDDPDEAAFDAEGVARVGNRIAVVQLIGYGQDYNYPAGQEPMVEAVRRAAAALG